MPLLEPLCVGRAGHSQAMDLSKFAYKGASADCRDTLLSLVRVAPPPEADDERPRFGNASADPEGWGLPGVWEAKDKSGRYRERLNSVCTRCAAGGTPCPHSPELPLRVLFIGHNPSDQAFRTGYAYANPTNLMTSCLTCANGGASLLPSWWKLHHQDEMPLATGVGLLDVRPEPGSDSSEFPISDHHRKSLFERLRLHMERCRASARALEAARAARDSIVAKGYSCLPVMPSHVADVDHGENVSIKRDTSHASGTAEEEDGRVSRKRDTSHASGTAEEEDGRVSRKRDTSRASGTAEEEDGRVSRKRDTSHASGTAEEEDGRVSRKRDASHAELDMPPAKRTPPSVAPAHVAFTGIKQFLEVFACKGLSTAQLRKRISSANPINTVLPPELFPPGWPFPHDTTKVWVLTSTSGRASAYSARTRAQYAELAKQVALVPWPRNDPSADWSASS
jgi:hypothetical protein